MPRPLPLSYVLPLRAESVDEELIAYLHDLVGVVAEVIVVESSGDEVFEEHERRWPAEVRHLRPTVETPMGKVGNVLSGLAEAQHDLVVLGDDDVRWDRALLEAAIAGLGDAEVARPHNAFHPSPWHARWDTGRSLINRALGGDWPGTMLVRRAALPHGYAGDVLFENLELVRTVRAGGGRAVALLDVVVPRRPPTTARFWEQRVRQAYDEWARPWRLAVHLALLPAVTIGRFRGLVVVAAGAVALAEVGRRRGGGRSHWGPTAALWAIPWTAERAVTSWLAVGVRARGGVRYRDGRLLTAAHWHRGPGAARRRRR